MTPKWIVVDWSQSCHCCFECTVVDATSQNGTGSNGPWYSNVACETYDTESAKIIADALNFSEGVE